MITKSRRLEQFRCIARRIRLLAGVEPSWSIYGEEIIETSVRLRGGEGGNEYTVAERIRTAQRKVEPRRSLVYFAPNRRRYCY